ncbi:site-specific integrase [Paracoccus aminophilus]|uniref:Phage integrase n=1 Tax=Paracoccus aminophilus JCM 7686 TaxID=1367847 RepID=S5YCZ7_PARAH|nr:phage integrase [Paracoccus aminophilus]AGT09338.1 phage integrase [Paracoccus aminophilus JCM 7686]
MLFKDALRDGSDPHYAPCTGVSRGILYWKCPKKYRDQGYQPTSIKLGRVGESDGLNMAREARRLTVAMLESLERPTHATGTWSWLIHRYETDEFSPFHRLKANSRKSYQEQLDRWKPVIGKVRIGALTYEKISAIETGMRGKGRSTSYIHRMMSMLRILAGYGKALRVGEARDVADTLSEMRFSSPPRRTAKVTRDQIEAIIAAADSRGLYSFSLGILIQWTYMLRAVDVRGQWLPDDGSEGGIIRDGKRWQDGLTWDMFAPDLSHFEKVISKTRKSMPEPFRFDITPEVAARLSRIDPTKRIGPVVVSNLGLPYMEETWRTTFARIRDRLDLPKNLWAMDIRSGAISEARDLGADPFSIRDAAQHANLKTTDRYMRGKSESAAKIVKLRTRQ